MTRQTTDEQPSTASSVVGGSLTILGGQVAIKLIAVVFNIVVIRYLGDEQYGKFAICAAFGGLFAILSDLGLAPLAVKRIARDQSVVGELFSNFLALRMILAAGVVVLTSTIAWIAGFEPDIRLGIFVASVALFSYAAFGLADAVAIGRERFRLSATFQVSNHLVFMVLAAALVFSGAGFLGLLIASALSPALIAIAGVRSIRRETPLTGALQRATWIPTLRAAFPFAAIGLALAVSYRADTVILSGFVSAATIGLYAVAYNLIFTIVSLSHSVNLALYPILTREQARSPEAAQQLFRDGMRYLFFLSVPFAVFLTIYAEGIVTLLYGAQFAGAALPLALLCWVIPLMFLAEFLGYVAIVVDRESLAARANWVSSGTNVAGNLAFIPFLGVVAAAIMTVLTELLLTLQYLVSLRHHGITVHLYDSLGRSVITAGAIGVLVAVMRFEDVHVLIAGAVAVPAYFVVAALTGAIGRTEFRFLLAEARRRSRWRQTPASTGVTDGA